MHIFQLMSTLRKIFILICLFNVCCSGKSTKFPQIPSRFHGVIFEMSPQMNQNQALCVHITGVYTESMAKKISNMSAQQYFQNISQLLTQEPNALRIWKFEMVPNHPPLAFVLNQMMSYNMHGIFLFANYATPGDHRINLWHLRIAAIQLGEENFANLTHLLQFPQEIMVTLQEPYMQKTMFPVIFAFKKTP